MSILTGFPFGHYVYTDKFGPKLWLVPLLIMPAYFSMGYIAWTIGHILLDRFDDRLAGAEVVLVPALASFVMVMWDLCIDPGSSTIAGAWIWRDGGSYFGVEHGRGILVADIPGPDEFLHRRVRTQKRGARLRHPGVSSGAGDQIIDRSADPLDLDHGEAREKDQEAQDKREAAKHTRTDTDPGHHAR